MKKIRLGINGFGRIGKLVYRVAYGRDDIEVVAINNREMSPEFALHTLKYDSAHGIFDVPTKVKDGKLVIGKNVVSLYNESDPANIPWKNDNVDVVVDCTGKFKTREELTPHLRNGAKRVVISAPGKDPTIPMFIMGVNNDKYRPEMDIISDASCTTNCLAPLAKVLNDNFGIERGIMSTIHSATASQYVVDGNSKKNWRLGRAASTNIIPSSTGAAEAIGEVIPELNGKLTGMSYRVPTIDVSVVDFSVILKTPTTYEKIVSVLKKASKNEMAGILGVTEEPLVSSDFLGDDRICIFDASAGIMQSPTFFKLVAWYDNEWGYATKLVDLCSYIMKK